MIDRLRRLIVEVTFFPCFEPMSSSTIIRPLALPKHEPQEDFNSQRRPRLPNQRVTTEGDITSVQHFVGEFGAVVLVRRLAPHGPVVTPLVL